MRRSVANLRTLSEPAFPGIFALCTEGYLKHLTIVVVLCLLLCASATRVEAQETASSFDQLAVLVKRGDEITVVDASGEETRGRIGRDSDGGDVLIPTAIVGGALFAGLGAAAGA